jgi:hypothetical protein
VAAFSLRGPRDTPPLRDDAPPFRMTLLLHVAPLVPFRTRLRISDEMMLVGSLSALLERLPAQSVRLVAFNLDQHKELYRKDNFALSDLSRLVQSVNELELQTVDYRVLQNKSGHIDLLADLVNQELRSGQPSDAVVFLGPAARFEDKVPAELLEQPAAGPTRFFYFQYKPIFRRGGNSFPDIINRTVSTLRGRLWTIHTPAEFAKAIEELEKRAKTN